MQRLISPALSSQDNEDNENNDNHAKVDIARPASHVRLVAAVHEAVDRPDISGSRICEGKRTPS